MFKVQRLDCAPHGRRPGGGGYAFTKSISKFIIKFISFISVFIYLYFRFIVVFY